MKSNFLGKPVGMLLSVFAMLALSACSAWLPGEGKEADPSEKVQHRQLELTFWNSWVGNEPWHRVVNRKVEEFEASHPNIKIRMETIPHDQYKVKVRVSAAGKQLPDMMVVWPGAELTPLVDGKVLAGIEEIARDYEDKLIPSSNMKHYSVDGIQYAIPTVVSYTSIIYYDKDLVAQAGFREFPKTFDEFLQLVRSLRELGMTPIALGNKGKWVLQSCYLSTIGSRYTGDDFLSKVMAGRRKFTDAEFVRALSVVQQLIELNAFNEDMNSLDNIGQQERFIQRQAAMFIEGSWALPNVMAKLPPNRRLGLAIFPWVDGGKGNPTGVSGVVGQGIALNANLPEEKKEAAFEFIRYINSEDTYRKLVDQQILVPAKMEIPSDANALYKQLAALTSGELSPVYDAVLPTELTDVVNSSLQDMALKSDSPEGVAAKIQSKMDEILERNRR